MDFPHLNDTKFPIIDNVNVYKYQNNFDYARWQGKVSFKLLNVLWNSNYADVPYFDTVKKRDEWFENEDGYVGTLESLFNSTPSDRIRIPIPYNEAYYYNYIMIDMPLQTSENNQINYEDKNRRVSKWFYFIEDMIQYAPNTTELVISVDYWTTFINSVDIPYLMLERGHAPMTKTSVEEYLKNPIDHNEYLLADDFNYGNDTIIANSNYKPIGNGTKYILFCAPYDYLDFHLFGGTLYSGKYTKAQYDNTTNRNGYQMDVSGYEWKFGKTDLSNAHLPISNEIQQGLLAGCGCFAIEGKYAQDFFNDIIEVSPHFMHGIQAMFMLDEDMFSRYDKFNFREYTLYIADKKLNDTDFVFTKEQFDFDEKYENITKLYTSPYSFLEITDDAGNTFTAKIENCSTVSMREEVSLVYPYLNYNILFSGINGAGGSNYVWKTVEDRNNDKIMWASDFSKFMMNWNIPIYCLYVSGENEYASNNFNSNQVKRQEAILEYKINTRNSNTDCENTKDIANATETNTYNLANTQNANVRRTNYGLMENMRRNIDAKKYIVNTLQYGGAHLGGGGYYSDINDANTAKISGEQAVDLAYVIDNLGLSMDYATSTSTNNAAAAVTSGWVTGVSNGLATGFSNGGSNAAGGAIAAGSIINGYVQSDNIQQNNLAFIAQQTGSGYNYNSYLRDKYAVLLNYIEDTYNVKKGYAKNLLDVETDLEERNTSEFSRVVNGNAGVNWQNSIDLTTTEKANITRMENTVRANAEYTRNNINLGNKDLMTIKQLKAKAAYDDAALQAPHAQGKYGGDYAPDVYQRRGVRMNIRTQSKSAIAQAGDAFLRFGYALHRVWDMKNGFHYGKHYTFWKAEDIWINDGSGVANAATNVIGNILLKGVTVWKNPHEIGCVGIYDNI